MKLMLIDRQYGCFQVIAKCDVCDKKLFNRAFSWNDDHIGMGEEEKINTIMEMKRQDMEMNYCFKCGHDLTIN